MKVNSLFFISVLRNLSVEKKISLIILYSIYRPLTRVQSFEAYFHCCCCFQVFICVLSLFSKVVARLQANKFRELEILIANRLDPNSIQISNCNWFDNNIQWVYTELNLAASSIKVSFHVFFVWDPYGSDQEIASINLKLCD